MKGFGTFLQGPGLGASMIRATIGSAGLRIGGIGFAFLLTLQLARALGPAAYGIYGTAMAVIAILTAAADLGAARLVTREVASSEVTGEWSRMGGVLAWSRRLALGLSMAFILATAAWTWLGWEDEPELLMTLLIGVASLPLITLANIDSAALTGLRHFVKGQIPEILLRPAFFSLFLFIASFLALPLTPMWAMAFGVAAAGIAYCTAAVLLRRNLPPEVRHERPAIESAKWFKSALPIALSDGVRVGQAHVVVLILAAMAADITTGHYRAAASIFSLFVVPEAMFNLLCAPIMTRLHSQGDKDRLQRMLSSAAAASTLATLALVAPFLIFGEALIVLVLGEEFRAATGPLLILSVGAVFIAAMGPGLVLMNIAARDPEVVRSGAIALVALVLLAGPSIMFMGAEGAALAFVVSSFLWRLIVRQRAVRLLQLDPSLASFRRFAAT